MSKSAGIFTGWGIVQHLLRKLAVNAGCPNDVDLEEWYRGLYDREPDYSELLDALARTPAERQQLLKPYFEPDEPEREQGLKQPTDAHRAIAQLVAGGFVRVIVTTNFDRLIETALNDAGVIPTVLSTVDQVAGALPLVHTGCCVLKVHGDYMDPRILNSPEELSEYDPYVDRLLDQIFDEFGLIVCGWSGDWDIALRKAVNRATSRRFTTYWASVGEPQEAASKLIEQRGARVIRIDGADGFFRSVQQNIESIVDLSQRDPLTREVAVTTMKRYLGNAEHRIRLADHIDAATRQALARVAEEEFPADEIPDGGNFTRRVRTYESRCSTLSAMAAVGGYWAEEEHVRDWQRSIARAYTMPYGSGNAIWDSLHKYPALVILYALGLGMVEAGHLELMAQIFRTSVSRGPGRDEQSYFLVGLIEDTREIRNQSLLPGAENKPAAFSVWLYEVLREPFGQFIVDEAQYTNVFDSLEILIALAFAQLRGRFGPDYWIPLGSFLYRSENRQRIITEIRRSAHRYEQRSPYVASGFLGTGSYQWELSLNTFEQYVSRSALSRGIF